MLRITHPSGFAPEREYILRVILGEWLGLDYVLQEGAERCVTIELAAVPDGKRIELSDVLFKCPQDQWLTSRSMPGQELDVWECPPELQALDNRLPVLYGERLANGGFLLCDQNRIACGVDVFGSALFMLTRYEELVRSERDSYDRFTAEMSLAGRQGFLERPIVNEYVELLWWLLKQQWPRLERRKRQYRCLLSCDVDNFAILGASPWRALRTIAGRFIRAKNFQRGANAAKQFFRGWQGMAGCDPLDNFDFMMEQAETHGLRFSFNLIAGHTDKTKDGIYSVRRRGIQRLMRRIHVRGHELGFHGSFHTHRYPERIRREFGQLHAAAATAGVEQNSWGGRQHYLRWHAPTTWQAYADAGLRYDSTVGFADRAGFRSGTCYEHTVFNLKARRSLPITERPLVAMERTLMAPEYMALSPAAAVEKVGRLADRCRHFNGDFTLLWHNCQTQSYELRQAFVTALGLAAKPAVA